MARRLGRRVGGPKPSRTLTHAMVIAIARSWAVDEEARLLLQRAMTAIEVAYVDLGISDPGVTSPPVADAERPSSIWSHSMAYSPATGTIVLFEGEHPLECSFYQAALDAVGEKAIFPPGVARLLVDRRLVDYPGDDAVFTGTAGVKP